MGSRRIVGAAAIVSLGVFCLSITGCARTPVNAASKDVSATLTSPSTAAGSVRARRIVRATGIVQAVRTHTVRVPQISQIAQTPGRSPQLTLTALVPNGTAVKKGDTLVEFDQTAQLDDAREAQAKLEDLRHQLEQSRAQVNSDSTKRIAKIREAEADLGKARLQLQKGPVLADLERKKNEVKADSARDQLASLNKSHEHRLKAEVAVVRILELKCERQKLVVERLNNNIEKMIVRAPHDGMVALESIWRSGSMGPPQVGDQVGPNQPVLRLFDPSEMVIETQVNEPDFGVLGTAMHAKVYIDAYPNVAFDGQLQSASPVATAGLESPVKSFSATFRISQRDPRLLPDLSASLEIEVDSPGTPERTARAAQDSTVISPAGTRRL